MNTSPKGMWKEWVGLSRASREYGLTRDQLEQALMLGIITGRPFGDGVIVRREELERNLDRIKQLPEKCWMYKTQAMKMYNLTRNQIEMAISLGLVRYKEVENPHYRSGPPSTLIYIPDLETNLERIRELPKYSEWEKERARTYRLKSKLRKELGFYCPRCNAFIHIRKDSSLFEELWESIASGDEEAMKEMRETAIVTHYRHVHTRYDYERSKVEKWLDKSELEEWRELISYYERKKHRMDRFEREFYIEDIRRFKALAAERAKRKYTELARKLAAEDGLLELGGESGSRQGAETPSSTETSVTQVQSSQA